MDLSGSLGLHSKPVQSDGTDASFGDESPDRLEVVRSRTSLEPVVEVEAAALPSCLDPGSPTLGAAAQEEERCPAGIIGSSPASYFKSAGPKVIRCFQVASDSLSSLGRADSVPACLASAFDLRGRRTCSPLCSRICEPLGNRRKVPAVLHALRGRTALNTHRRLLHRCSTVAR